MLAATGLAATVAAAGMAAAPAGAATSGKLYACYSDKTKALYYSKPGAKCAKGFTQISWSKQGPQGAQGARGAQGPQGSGGTQGSQGAQGSQGSQGGQGGQGGQGSQGTQGSQGAQGRAGAVAGYVKATTRATTLSPAGDLTVVASITPATPANYAVTGMAQTSGGTGGAARWTCRDQVANGSGGIGGTTLSAREGLAKSQPGTLTTTGMMHASTGSTLYELCATVSHSLKVDAAELTAVEVSSINPATPSRLKPSNRTVIPRHLTRGKRPPDSHPR